MHFSAKRGIAIPCRLSVRPSVCDVGGSAYQDHVGWKNLIAATISPTPSLFAAQSPPTYSQGNIGKFWGN